MKSVLLWIPVGAVVAALFLVPSSTEAAAKAGSLTITPYENYVSGQPGTTTGGQLVRFSGDIGNGSVRLFMERRGNLTSPWAKVPDPRTGVDFSITTQADGSFDFDFPAPAMNNPYFRLAGGGEATEVYQFHSVFQDVEVKGATTVSVGDPLVLIGDTKLRAQDHRPVFPGRGAALQIRNGSGGWVHVSNGTVDGAGQIAFPTIVPAAAGTLVYRIRLDDWRQNGDDIGWHPSFPFSVTVNP